MASDTDIFLVVICHLYIFVKISVDIFCSFLNWVVFLLLSLDDSFYILDVRYVICKYFLPDYILSFHFLNNVFHKAEVFNSLESNLSIFPFGINAPLFLFPFSFSFLFLFLFLFLFFLFQGYMCRFVAWVHCMLLKLGV